MASMPTRHAPAARRASRPEQQPQSPTQSQPPVQSRSEGSQAVFVPHPADEAEPQQRQSSDFGSEKVQAATSPSPYDPADDPSIKRCWICFSDETEDTPETSPWRDPCPCALIAHEECLLDWIADMEAPSKSARRNGIASLKIECPQCKSEITLARPRDYVVEAVRGLERIGAPLVLPTVGVALYTALHHISTSVGIHSIYAVFGAEDGFRILRPMFVNVMRPPVETYVGRPAEVSQQLLGVLLDHAVHWRLYLGLPLITPLLVLSRTSIADSILPLLPIVFFASQAHSPDDTLDFAQWPPSASFAFAVLPYARLIYNAYYKKFWAEKEKRWLNAIQPRGSLDQAGGDGAPAGNAEQGQVGGQQLEEGENVFEIRVDQGLWDPWDGGEERLVQEAADRNPPAQPAQQPPQPALQDQAEPPPDIQDNRRQAQQGQQQPGAVDGQQHEEGAQRRLAFSPTGVAETVIGALFFPTIAGLAGECLKLVLPRSWTTHAQSSYTSSGMTFYGIKKPALTGFLQAKWARSLVGGCLFVVCKDALMLYVRWRMAQMHRRRRVVDVDRKRLDAEKARTRT